MPGMREVQRGLLNRVQHPDRQCTRQQNCVLDVHANDHSSNIIIKQVVLVEEALRVLEAGQSGGGGHHGGPGGGVVKSCLGELRLGHFGNVLCMVIIHS